MGSMGLASNLGKVAVRPCKLPCWEPAENPPPLFPSLSHLSFDKKPRASPFPLPTWHKFNLAFLTLRCFYPEKKSIPMPGKNLQLPGSGHLARG